MLEFHNIRLLPLSRRTHNPPTTNRATRLEAHQHRLKLARPPFSTSRPSCALFSHFFNCIFLPTSFFSDAPDTSAQSTISQPGSSSAYWWFSTVGFNLGPAAAMSIMVIANLGLGVCCRWHGWESTRDALRGAFVQSLLLLIPEGLKLGSPMM